MKTKQRFDIAPALVAMCYISTMLLVQVSPAKASLLTCKQGCHLTIGIVIAAIATEEVIGITACQAAPILDPLCIPAILALGSRQAVAAAATLAVCVAACDDH